MWGPFVRSVDLGTRTLEADPSAQPCSIYQPSWKVGLQDPCGFIRQNLLLIQPQKVLAVSFGFYCRGKSGVVCETVYIISPLKGAIRTPAREARRTVSKTRRPSCSFQDATAVRGVWSTEKFV